METIAKCVASNRVGILKRCEFLIGRFNATELSITRVLTLIDGRNPSHIRDILDLEISEFGIPVFLTNVKLP